MTWFIEAIGGVLIGWGLAVNQGSIVIAGTLFMLAAFYRYWGSQ